MPRLLVRSAVKVVVGLTAICLGVPALQRPATVDLSLAPDGPPTLTVHALAHDLAPGRAAALVLVVHNEATSPAVVRRITTSVREQLPGCTLTAPAWTGSVVVGPHASVSRTVPAHLSGPACARRTWTLDITAATD
ncbi:MAG: hypothetical protein ACXVGH_06605 [Mycobacteriales bacterium]